MLAIHCGDPCCLSGQSIEICDVQSGTGTVFLRGLRFCRVSYFTNAPWSSICYSRDEHETFRRLSSGRHSFCLSTRIKVCTLTDVNVVRDEGTRVTNCVDVCRYAVQKRLVSFLFYKILKIGMYRITWMKSGLLRKEHVVEK